MSENIQEQENLVIKAVLDLNKKLDAFEYILKEAKNPRSKVAFEIFDELITIYRLILESMVVNLSWLYEKTWKLNKHGNQCKDKKVRSLYWYLEEQIKNYPTKATEFSSQIAKADDLEATVKKLRSVRDKLIVHKDKIAFENPDKFLKEVGLTFEDIKKLIKTADEIIHEHSPVNSFSSKRN